MNGIFAGRVLELAKQEKYNRNEGKIISRLKTMTDEELDDFITGMTDNVNQEVNAIIKVPGDKDGEQQKLG